ncbi:unnamed protein product [Parnassius apollo]|uniref:(apollo) hypothetical protein n=1 Tax=Parnassius apollo TaxID=110799 RepID=A0A8S3XPY6_PARAO|nr:unnamed protein product [Parnassius apollo]
MNDVAKRNSLERVLYNIGVHDDEDISCKTPSGDAGQCVEILECRPLLAALNKPYRTSQDFDILRKSQCGYRQTIPKVCCPVLGPVPTSDRKCLTPNGYEGKCISLNACPHLNSMMQLPISYAAKTFLQNSRCNGPTELSVCCGPPPTTTGTTVTRLGECTPSAAPPDPRSECCGIDGGNNNRIVGGNETAIDQYPWLALIEYTDGSRIKLLCGGVLISGRYVLTAAHCITGAVLDLGTPINVRLGEYDITNSGPDCVEVEGGGSDCTDGALVFPIEHIIAHPNYGLRRHDIALIRISKTAPYTDFIRPICLPTTDVTISPRSDMRLYVAGWGAVDTFKSSSDKKMHVDLPYVTRNECKAMYYRNTRQPPENISIRKGQICAGGEIGKDSCKGDSGGPLMYENGRLYEVVGIVSFGPTPCGQLNIPGVYTNVYEYLPWIRSQIRP